MEKACLFSILDKFIFFLLLLRLVKLEIPYYKIIYLYEDRYFLINTNELKSLDITNHINKTINYFNETQFKSQEETEMVSFGKFKNNNYVPNLLIIKDFVYALNFETFHCSIKMKELEEKKLSEVIPYKCQNSKCFYFLATVNSLNEFYLYLYDNPDNACDSKLISNYNTSIGSENVKCLTMISPSNGDVLTCFYNIFNSSEIVASSFSVDLQNKTFGPIQALQKTKETNGAKNISASLSKNDTKAYVCFINDKNNLDCLIYNITNNEWTNLKTYINDCQPQSSFYFDYYSISNEYFLYCFESSTKFNLIKLNENFEVKSKRLDIECKEILKNKFNDTQYSLSSMIYNKSEINMFVYTKNGIDYIKIPEINNNNQIIVQEKSNKTKEEVLDNIETDIKKYDIGKIYEIFGNDYNIKISPINLDASKNISTHINFANCEKILREKNGLSPLDILIVYLIEIYNKYEESLNNKVEYEVFNENKEKLDLSVCQNENIEVNYHLNTSKVNVTKIYYYSNLGIDIFNIEGDFFKTICYPFSEGESDIILTDRINDIYQNYSVCEDNCQYVSVDLNKSLASCKCLIKNNTNSIVKPPKLERIIRDSFEYTNLAVVKCYNLFFSFKNKFDNIGFWIFSILILLHFPLFIHYFFNDISLIQKYIIFEMEKYHYWKELRNPQKKIKKKKINFKKNLQRVNKVKNETEDITIVKTNQKEKSEENNSNISNNILIFKNKNSKNEIISEDHNIKKIKKRNNGSRHFTTDNLSKGANQNDEKNIHLLEKYYLIQIDSNNSINDEPPNSNILLDNYNFETAILYDKRSFWRLFYICILMKENIINILFYKNPLEVQSLRICLFIFIYSCDLAFNTIFYSNENISEKYHYKGNNIFLFSIVNNMVESVFSSIISLVIVNLFQHMIESRGSYEDVFRKEETKMRKNKNYKVTKETKYQIYKKLIKICNFLKCKIILFIIFEFLLMLFFYYFVTVFCEVYKKTQASWLYDFFVSFLISFAFEIFGAFLIAIFYILSLRYKIKFLYLICLFFYEL